MNLQRAEFLATELMRQHGLWDQRWSFKFDRSLTRLGYCNYRKRVISLGQHATLANDEVAVRNTILHEIAHALCGYGEGHGSVWKAKCLEIGGNGQRLGHIAAKAPHKYQISCNDCKVTWKYYRKPNRWITHPNAVHKCSALLQRIGYTPDKPWTLVPSNLKVEVLA
jgi:predicted SprT family Zn-dependent metalloprotease